MVNLIPTGKVFFDPEKYYPAKYKFNELLRNTA